MYFGCCCDFVEKTTFKVLDVVGMMLEITLRFVAPFGASTFEGFLK